MVYILDQDHAHLVLVVRKYPETIASLSCMTKAKDLAWRGLQLS
ncbi:hypothetical protein G9274_003565 [Stenotrophomonas rhizophila]|jgi:hypothetical protein|nr:hypothetical protein G9274_003565 [Stenotrophomonas rhizophila]